MTMEGDKLFDQYLAMHLLMSLPDNYQTIVIVVNLDNKGCSEVHH